MLSLAAMEAKRLWPFVFGFAVYGGLIYKANGALTGTFLIFDMHGVCVCCCCCSRECIARSYVTLRVVKSVYEMSMVSMYVRV